jgi:hypothetical protein
LFQNGRALLKCRIFILLQLVIPTLKSHAATRQLRHVRAHCEQTFQDGVFFVHIRCVPVSCSLCCCRVPLQPQFRQFHRELLFIFVWIAKIRQVLTSLISPFALFRAFVLSVLLLSSTPATVSPIFQYSLLIFVDFAKIRQMLCCC